MSPFMIWNNINNIWHCSGFSKYGAKFLARGGASEVLEGQEFERHVVIEFPDMETARECYFSPEYQLAKSKPRLL